VNGDQLVERGATRLLELADRAAARGDGIGEWLSQELRDDAAFLRKLKPSLVKARAKDNGATNSAPTSPEPEAPPPAPAAETPVVETPIAESEPTETRAAPPPPSPKPKSKKPKPKKRRGGPPPVVIVGAALVAGIVLAKVIDWRGHAHPRD
jgi:hypothetical protein